MSPSVVCPLRVPLQMCSENMDTAAEDIVNGLSKLVTRKECGDAAVKFGKWLCVRTIIYLMELPVAGALACAAELVGLVAACGIIRHELAGVGTRLCDKSLGAVCGDDSAEVARGMAERGLGSAVGRCVCLRMRVSHTHTHARTQTQTQTLTLLLALSLSLSRTHTLSLSLSVDLGAH